MAKTYSETVKQIEQLRAEAEDLRRQEIAGVVERIREAIQTYGLTAADLGLSRAKTASPSARAARKAAPGAKKAGRKPGAKYSDGQGNTWGGRGPRPQWLRTALESGKSLEDFRA